MLLFPSNDDEKSENPGLVLQASTWDNLQTWNLRKLAIHTNDLSKDKLVKQTAVSIHSRRRPSTIWRGESMLSRQRTVSVDVASIDGIDYVWTLLKTKLLEGSVLWIQVVECEPGLSGNIWSCTSLFGWVCNHWIL
jgi:hypothetical protein